MHSPLKHSQSSLQRSGATTLHEVSFVQFKIAEPTVVTSTGSSILVVLVVELLDDVVVMNGAVLCLWTQRPSMQSQLLSFAHKSGSWAAHDALLVQLSSTVVTKAWAVECTGSTVVSNDNELAIGATKANEHKSASTSSHHNVSIVACLFAGRASN